MLLEGRSWALEGRALAVGGQTITVRGLRAEYGSFLLPLFGRFAARSAAAAIVATEALLGRALDEEAARRALAEATSPGRLEVATRRPLVILDGAHNPAAAEALAEALAEAFAWDRLHLVIAVLTNKDLDGISDRLAPLADIGYATVGSGRRGRPAVEIASALTARGVATQTFPSIPEAVSAALDAAREGDRGPARDDGANGPGHGSPRHDPWRPRAGHHGEPRARQRLARIGRARVEAVLRIAACSTPNASSRTCERGSSAAVRCSTVRRSGSGSPIASGRSACSSRATTGTVGNPGATACSRPRR